MIEVTRQELFSSMEVEPALRFRVPRDLNNVLPVSERFGDLVGSDFEKDDMFWMITKSWKRGISIEIVKTITDWRDVVGYSRTFAEDGVMLVLEGS